MAEEKNEAGGAAGKATASDPPPLGGRRRREEERASPVNATTEEGEEEEEEGTRERLTVAKAGRFTDLWEMVGRGDKLAKVDGTTVDKTVKSWKKVMHFISTAEVASSGKARGGLKEQTKEEGLVAESTRNGLTTSVCAFSQARILGAFLLFHLRWAPSTCKEARVVDEGRLPAGKKGGNNIAG